MRPSSLAAGVYFGRPETQRVVGALTLCRTSYAPRQQIPEHAHDAGYLCLALCGSFRERAGRAEEEVAAGAAVLHRPGERHADHFGAQPSSCLNVSFAPAWLERAGALLADGGRALYAPPGAVAPLVAKLAREYELLDEASQLAIEALTLELLAFFLRASRRTERRPPEWMRATVEQLHCEERTSLGALARAAGVHPSTLARVFRRFQGCSLGEYRRRARLARALEALGTSTAPLAEIAVQTGYADQSHLTRVMRAALGVGPAAYRRAVRG